MLRLYTTLSRKKESFTPLEDNNVRMYSCGPTVYDYPHIGNLRAYIMVDTLKRYLLYKGFDVTHVMNITDVGHLTSDEDEGEDKLEKGAAREKKTVWEVAEFYTEVFKKNIAQLNIISPDILAKATDHIPDMVALIEQLARNGFTYQTDQAVYFDVTKFPNYTQLSGQPLQEKLVGARSEVRIDPQKRHPQDFALWFLRVGKFANHTMHWPSPWGEGFPGWHIECSAMSMKYLGETFDIHIGGVDHIPVHHTNEIAQSQAATGKPLAKFWLHSEFLSVDDKKMSKSAGTYITLQDIIDKGFSPLSFRLLALQAHYRSTLNFTWNSLKGAQESLLRVENLLKSMGKNSGQRGEQTSEAFTQAMDDNLNTPQALSVFFEQLRYINNPNFDQTKLRALLLDMDRVFGLGLERLRPGTVIQHEGIIIKNETGENLPTDIFNGIKKRLQAKKDGDWTKADSLREMIEGNGYIIEDRTNETIIKRDI